MYWLYNNLHLHWHNHFFAGKFFALALVIFFPSFSRRRLLAFILKPVPMVK